MDSYEDRRSMYLKIRTFGVDHTADVAVFSPAMTDAMAEFNDELTVLEQYRAEKAVDITGITEQKEENRIILRTKSLTLSGALRALFLKLKDKDGAKRVKFTKSKFNNLRDTEFKDFVSNLITEATANAAALVAFGFDAARIAAVNTAYVNYDSIIASPLQKRGKRAKATQLGNAQHAVVDEKLEIVDAIMLSVLDLAYGLNVLYNYNRGVDNTGVAHTPPNFTPTVGPGQLLVVFTETYSAIRVIRVKNLSTTDGFEAGLTTLPTGFTNGSQTVNPNTISTKASKTFGPNGDIFLVHNTSPNPITFEVTIFE